MNNPINKKQWDEMLSQIGTVIIPHLNQRFQGKYPFYVSVDITDEAKDEIAAMGPDEDVTNYFTSVNIGPDWPEDFKDSYIIALEPDEFLIQFSLPETGIIKLQGDCGGRSLVERKFSIQELVQNIDAISDAMVLWVEKGLITFDVIAKDELEED